jgi:tRNA-binding protein
MGVSWEDFEKLDIRIGTIMEVNDFPKAKKAAYQLNIDFGECGKKKSSAQITQLYSKGELVGQQVIAILNFPPKQIAGFFSECLVLGINTDNNEVILLQPERKTKNGCKIG